MSARRLLENPALFTGADKTPWETVRRFFIHTLRDPLPYGLVIHHVTEMTRKNLSRTDRSVLQQAGNMVDLVDWFESRSALEAK